MRVRVLRRLVPLVALAALSTRRVHPKGATGCDAVSGRAGSRQAAPFVVAIVVDQLAAWIAEERFPELPARRRFRLAAP